MNRIQEQVTGPRLTYGIEATFDPPHLQGRLGGSVMGKNLHLEVQDNRVTGRVGGLISGFAVQGKLGPQGEVRLGGEVLGRTLKFEVRGSEVKGHLGGELLGRDFECTLSPGHLQGHIGDGEFRHQLHLEGEGEPQLLVLLGLLAFVALDECTPNTLALPAEEAASTARAQRSKSG